MQLSQRVVAALGAGIALTAVGQLVLIYQLHTLNAVVAGNAPPRRKVVAEIPSAPMSLAGATTTGARTAAAAMIEFSDFQCPYCAKFAGSTLQTLKSDYVVPGKLLLAYRHLPAPSIHPEAMAASQAAACAGRQQKFWEMHDALFEKQRQLSPEVYRSAAAGLGLKSPEFNACLTGPEPAEIATDLSMAQTLDITATPTFLIGQLRPDGTVNVRTRLQGARPVAEFRSAIDAVLAAETR